MCAFVGHGTSIGGCGLPLFPSFVQTLGGQRHQGGLVEAQLLEYLEHDGTPPGRELAGFALEIEVASEREIRRLLEGKPGAVTFSDCSDSPKKQVTLAGSTKNGVRGK